MKGGRQRGPVTKMGLLGPECDLNWHACVRYQKFTFPSFIIMKNVDVQMLVAGKKKASHSKGEVEASD